MGGSFLHLPAGVFARGLSQRREGSNGEHGSSHRVVDEDLGASVGGSHTAPLEAELRLDPGSRISPVTAFPAAAQHRTRWARAPLLAESAADLPELTRCH